MAPGKNLGEMHKRFNELVKDAKKHTLNVDEPNVNESDIRNLINIDVANANKNVEFILKTLECSDLLYIIRALKNCDWLINDEKYAHIINPEYLNANLYPRMQTKAVFKLKHLINLKLKNELRAEQFYNYETKSSEAIKWLHKCSIKFIENNFSKHADEINIPILVRLCEKSIIFLEKYAEREYVSSEVFLKTLFLLHVNVDKYLDIVESKSIYSQPKFGKRATKVLMTKCPKRIIDKFSRYCNYIDTPTFVKYLNDDLQIFLMKNIVNEDNENELTRYFSSVTNWTSFLSAMSKSKRVEFINQYFISEIKSNEIELGKTIKLIRHLQYRTPSYRWYEFFPFELAFSNVKSIIGLETDAKEKNKMLETIILSAKGNLEHGKRLLEYFRKKHMNFPKEIKISFLVNFMSHFNTHKLNEDCWKNLQHIIDSLDIYNKYSFDKTIIENLVVYQILHHKSVPEITAKLLTLCNSFKTVQTKLDPKEKETIFKYLLDIKWKEVQSNKMKRDHDFLNYIESLKSALILLKEWNKNILDYPFVLEEIRQLVKMKHGTVWYEPIKSKINNIIPSLYNVQKSWRRHMFTESIILSPTEEVCVNIIKHNPNLLDLYKNEVESIFSNNDVSLRRLLRKVRIYWPESIYRYWKNVYINHLNQSDGQNAITRGLCILLSKEELLMFLNKHAPIDSKDGSDNMDDLELGLQRCLAKNMHNARPQPNLETVLSYAKGDYLKYALPSVLAVYYNMSSIQYQEVISQILNTPVSLQKHGLRLLTNKLSSERIRELCSALCKDAKNTTIRTGIFKIVFELLCNEKDELNVVQSWALLEILIDNLTFLEDKSIYELLYNVDQIPQSIKAKFLVKSYNYLKNLIENNQKEFEGSEWDVQRLVMYSIKIIDAMPSEFMTAVIDDYVNNEFFKERTYSGDKTKLISSYILCSITEEEQMKKYDELLAPILIRSIKLWNDQIKSNYIKENIEKLLFDLIYDLEDFIDGKKMIVPVKIFTIIQKMLQQSLPLSENYILIRTWQLATNLVTLFDKNQPIIWEDTCIKTAPEFGEICKNYLSKDTLSLFPRIYILFMKAFANINRLFSENIQYEICKSFVEKEDFLAGYLAALQFTTLLRDDEKIKVIRENIRKHPSVEIKMHYYDMFQQDQATLCII